MLHDDGINDRRKVLLPLDAMGLYHFALMLASTHSERGTIPSVDDLAFRIHRPVKTVTRLLSALEGAGLVEQRDDGSILLTEWESDQPDVGPRTLQSSGESQATLSNAERQRRHRDRKRSETLCSDILQVPDSGDRNVTRVTPSVTRVTAPVTGNVTPVTVTPYIREEDTKQEGKRNVTPPVTVTDLGGEETGALRAKVDPLKEYLAPRPVIAPAPLEEDGDEPFVPPAGSGPAPTLAVEAYPNGVTEADVVAAESKVVAIFGPDSGMSRNVRPACRAGVKPAWIIEASEIMATRNVTNKGWRYLIGIVSRWQAQGASEKDSLKVVAFSPIAPPPKGSVSEKPKYHRASPERLKEFAEMRAASIAEAEAKGVFKSRNPGFKVPQ